MKRLREFLERRWFGALVLGGLAFALYLTTAARSAVYGDGPELATAAYQLGVPHPTGYPLYTLLAHLFIRLVPVGEVIFRTTLFSAVTCALAVSVLYILGTYLFRRRWIAAFVAALVAVAEVFWAQAVVTEVYGLHMLLTSSMLTAAIVWDRTARLRWLYATMALVGLSLSHHLMSVTWLPALALLLGTSPHRSQIRRAWPKLLLTAVLPLLLYIYLPIAAWRDPYMNWGDIRNLRNFVDHVTGAQYRFRMGHTSWSTLWRSIYNYVGWPVEHKCEGYLLTQFNVAILWLAPVGIWSLLRRARRLFWWSLAGYAFPVAWALNYNIPDIDAYFLLSHVVVAIWIGYGVREVEGRLFRWLSRFSLTRSQRQRIRGLSHALIGVLPATILIANWEANDKRRLPSSIELGRAVLDRLPPNSVLFASGDDWSFSIIYAHQVEGRRRDVTVLPEPFFQGRNWRLIQRHASRRIVVREPDCSRKAANKDAHGGCRLRQFILDNYRRAPLYMAGPFVRRIEQADWFRRQLPKYEYVAGLAPLIHFLPDSVPERPPSELADSSK